jgi:hypothetical protein
MKDYHLVAAVLGVGLAIVILTLVRRDHIHLRQGLFWIAVAVGSLVFGIWPGLLDLLGQAVGIAYSPALLFLVAIVVLVLRALFTDIALTQLRRDLRRLNPRIALAESAAAGRDDGEPPPADDQRGA